MRGVRRTAGQLLWQKGGEMNTNRRRALQGGLAVAASVLGAPAVHGRKRVSSAVALGIDISRSVIPARFNLEKDGSVAALLHEDTIAMVEGLSDPIMLMFFFWARGQMIVADWSVIRTRQDMKRFCKTIEACGRPSEDVIGYHTFLGSAIDFGREQLLPMRPIADRLVLDIAGDGGNSDIASRLPEKARDEAVDQNITINGLPIVAETSPAQPKEGLDVYYEERVIGGSGAFRVVAQGFGDFERAFGKKFIREVAYRE